MENLQKGSAEICNGTQRTIIREKDSRQAIICRDVLVRNVGDIFTKVIIYVIADSTGLSIRVTKPAAVNKADGIQDEMDM